MPAVVPLIHVKWKKTYQAYYGVVKDHTSISMEREYKLVPQFNYTQKDHGEKPKEDPFGVLNPFKTKQKKSLEYTARLQSYT